MLKWGLRVLGALLAIVVLLALVIYGLYRQATREPALSGTLQTATLTVNGMPRTFSFYKPSSKDGAPALVFLIHGSAGSGEQIRTLGAGYLFDQIADRENFITVYPDGYKKYWNDCRASAQFETNKENIDDPAFFRAMIDYFVQQHHVDKRRVYAMGISNGGHMVYRLGFEMPEAFAALAPVAANLPVDSNNDCKKSGKPVSIAIFNGVNDPANPYNGGFMDPSRGAVVSSNESAAYWTQLIGDVSASTQRYPELDDNPKTWVDVHTWSGANNTEVRLYALHGVGHMLPMRHPYPLHQLMGLFLGGIASDLDGAGEIWNFFKAHTITFGADEKATP